MNIQYLQVPHPNLRQDDFNELRLHKRNHYIIKRKSPNASRKCDESGLGIKDRDFVANMGA
jgi:hypothetical protein